MANSPSTETEAPAVTIKPILRSAISFFEARHNHWSAIVPRGIDETNICLSALWSVVCDRMQPFDRVVAIAEDRSFYAELLVLDAGRGFCSMQILHFHKLPALLISEAGLPPGFDVFWAGPVLNGGGGYSVKRLTDNVLITSGHANREAALTALLEHASLR